jgi:hypothetical protein
VHPEGIATSTEDPDTVTGNELVTTFDALALGKGEILEAVSAEVAAAGRINPTKSARLTEIEVVTLRLSFTCSIFCKLPCQP